MRPSGTRPAKNAGTSSGSGEIWNSRFPVPPDNFREVLLGAPSDVRSRALSVPSPQNELSNQFVWLTLQKTAVVDTTITADNEIVSKGNITIPEGTTYDLPIPTAALFGMQKFTLALNDAGAITSVDYAKNTGAAGAANAATRSQRQLLLKLQRRKRTT